MDLRSVDFHKHLGLILDSKMNYTKHLDGKINQANQDIVVVKRLYISTNLSYAHT